MRDEDNVPLESPSDDELLRAAAEGCPDAFSAFCLEALPGLVCHVKARCRSRGIPNSEVHDLVNETICKAIEHIRRKRDRLTERQPQFSKAWLQTIASHLISDWTRRKKQASAKAKEVLERARASAPDVDAANQCEELLKYVGRLSRSDQQMIELIYLEGLHVWEAGERLGLPSREAAYKRHQRALDRLKLLLKLHSEHFPSHLFT